MFSGEWLMLGLAILVAGCQGEYPIGATACDEWCEATQGGPTCEYYDPSGCVSLCETQRLARIPDCRPLFDTALACFQQTPGAGEAVFCSFSSFGGPGVTMSQASELCRAASETLTLCVGTYSFGESFQ